MDLLGKIKTKQAVVGIIGLGYVGLPLVLRFCEVGFKVLGFDTDAVQGGTPEPGGVLYQAHSVLPAGRLAARPGRAPGSLPPPTTWAVWANRMS